MKWAAVWALQNISIARLRGLENLVVFWTWGFHPRLYACACFRRLKDLRLIVLYTDVENNRITRLVRTCFDPDKRRPRIGFIKLVNSRLALIFTYECLQFRLL